MAGWVDGSGGWVAGWLAGADEWTGAWVWEWQ